MNIYTKPKIRCLPKRIPNFALEYEIFPFFLLCHRWKLTSPIDNQGL